LPKAIREELNLRLQDGEEGALLVAWLNSLPAVQSLLAAQFNGQPVNEPNLSHWKSGGYRDWESRRDCLDAIRLFNADDTLFRKAGGDGLTDKLALWLAARIAVALRQDPGDPADTGALEARLRRLCADLVALRKGDHYSRWLRIKTKSLDLELKKFNHHTAVERKELREKRNPRRKSIPRAVLDQVVKELNLL
jgi:hypothetical protein